MSECSTINSRALHGKMVQVLFGKKVNKGYRMTDCQKMEQLIRDECAKQGVTNESHIAYMVATAMWETNHTCKPVKEAYWLSEDWRNKHLRYYPYFGRGLIQITLKENYEKFSKLLDIDLVNYPDRALDEDIAVKILVIGMRDGLFTGKSLQDFTDAQGNIDFYEARRIVNGLDKASTIASMAQEICHV